MEKSTKILIWITGIVAVISIGLMILSVIGNNNTNNSNVSVSVQQTTDKPF